MSTEALMTPSSALTFSADAVVANPNQCQCLTGGVCLSGVIVSSYGVLAETKQILKRNKKSDRLKP